jgi:hypothetical protein
VAAAREEGRRGLDPAATAAAAGPLEVADAAGDTAAERAEYVMAQLGGSGGGGGGGGGAREEESEYLESYVDMRVPRTLGNVAMRNRASEKTAEEEEEEDEQNKEEEQEQAAATASAAKEEERAKDRGDVDVDMEDASAGRSGGSGGKHDEEGIETDWDPTNPNAVTAALTVLHTGTAPGEVRGREAGAYTRSLLSST